jgi:glycosyltransferase involved in cell wall biosynthesis
MVTVDITGILPTYNRAGLIDRAIRSMLSQSSPLAEIIVVDDGSKDETREVVKRYGDRVRHVYQQNAGGGAARNRGVEEVRTPWEAFLDSDDLWAAVHLKRIVRAITCTSGSADVYFDDTIHRSVRESRSRYELSGFVLEREHLLTEDGTAWMMLERQPVMLQASVIKGSTFMGIGGFWEALTTAHDTHFFLRLGIAEG